MKTPKRTPWQWTNEHCLKANGELRATINEQCTRWKRKNKIAQFKRTIARLEAENFELECLSTRITYEGTMQEMLTF